MTNTHTPLPYDYLNPDLGHHGPLVDGLLIARKIVVDADITDMRDEVLILRSIDRRIEEVKRGR